MIFVIQFAAFFFIDNPEHFAWFWFLSNVGGVCCGFFGMNILGIGILLDGNEFLFRIWNLSVHLSLFYLIYRLIVWTYAVNYQY